MRPNLPNGAVGAVPVRVQPKTNGHLFVSKGVDTIAPMPFEPVGKVAVITGSAGGIGLGIARAFTSVGMRIVLSDIDTDRVETAAAELRANGHDAIGVGTDVSQLTSVQALAEAAMDTYGRVDVLCNNAGVAMFAKIVETTIQDWEWTLGIDLWGPIYGVKTFLPLIERNPEQGHINSTSSIAGLVAGATVAPYNVAKHAVVALMATLERELRSSKSLHHASVLCPGPINTDIGRNSVRRRHTDAAAATTKVAPLDRATGSEPGRKLGDKMTNALSLGMDPDEVGRLVLDGILNDRFWILTHPKLLRHVREQLDLTESDGLLTKGRLV